MTHVLDKGLPLDRFQGAIDGFGDFIDVWKFGYGLAYIDRQLDAKLRLLQRSGIKGCPGGTLAEISWAQRCWTPYLAWLEKSGFDCVEISNGATGMPAETKRNLISEAADRGLEVFSEVGSKDPSSIVSPEAWVDEAGRDLEAGASWIVAEGRESGTVGLYDDAGGVRSALVDALEELMADTQVIYEAPRREQQAWLIRHVGANVSLGNVPIAEVPSLEALRLGLRADTMARSPKALGGQCST